MYCGKCHAAQMIPRISVPSSGPPVAELRLESRLGEPAPARLLEQRAAEGEHERELHEVAEIVGATEVHRSEGPRHEHGPRDEEQRDADQHDDVPDPRHLDLDHPLEQVKHSRSSVEHGLHGERRDERSEGDEDHRHERRRQSEPDEDEHHDP